MAGKLGYRKPHAFRKCKHCEKEVARNIRPDGRSQGYYKTCGSSACLKRKSGRKMTWHKIIICAYCGEETPKKGQSKYCPSCVPDGSSWHRLNRYGISRPDYLAMIRKVSGICPICEIRKAVFVDHDHVNGKVRGLICSNCNTHLPFIEDKEKLERALKYLEPVEGKYPYAV